MIEEIKEKIKLIKAAFTEIFLAKKKLRDNNEELSELYKELTASEEKLRQQLDEISTSNELLQLSEERFKTLVDNSKDIIYSCDISGVFTAVNRRFSQYMNMPIKQIVGKKFSDLTSNKEHISKWEEVLNKVVTTGKTIYTENKYGKDTVFEVTISPIFDVRKKVIGITGTNHDITDKRNNEEIIRHMAYYDDLTELPNKLYFYRQLKNEIENSKGNTKRILVLFLDIDDFKRINDTLGHVFGDDLLRQCAERLKLSIRKSDFISRVSGDKFVIILKNADDLNEAVLVIDRILGTFNDAFYIGSSALNMTASIGISVFPSDGGSVEDLIRCADTAMYRAKELGKNRYQFYNIEMKNKLLKKLNIELMLRKAIANNELILYYQPQFYAKTKKLRGFEALIRWNNPKLGFLNPLEFISTAEETGLITSIGEWILNTACCFARKINDTYMSNLTIAVNISPLQLKQSNFYDMVLKAVKNSGIRPENLELEVTENMLIDDFDYTLNLLTELKKYGIKIALDDFGTGYSSLSYLKKLPLDLLKIDKSFIDEINKSSQNNDFTKCIISLVHKLDIEALAEGVENTFQYDYLVNADVDCIQGFYLGKPLPAVEIENLAKSYCKQENLI
ncbi:EAL domain-containing protein [Clostridium sp. JN-9]|uniref:EAL domain-containing protein n=1 Tax=Clostridium sp. JN-9 TaxID=2507159 RepID=UPI000FFE0570|nr:EAL domain-containing protein [Clostridium sp. JN-9]QAT40599.1 EAL domain-containing protein [Clostridium sp. JN-9]